MRGKIIDAIGTPRPNLYKVQGENGESYFAHMGDVLDNENLLYRDDRAGETTILEKDDVVEFQLEPEHAIHVKLIKKHD